MTARILRERGLSYPVIGRLLNRDHTTVMHCLRHFEMYERRDPRVTDVYEELRER